MVKFDLNLYLLHTFLSIFCLFLEQIQELGLFLSFWNLRSARQKELSTVPSWECCLVKMELQSFSFLVVWVLVLPGYWQLFLFTLEGLSPIIPGWWMFICGLRGGRKEEHKHFILHSCTIDLILGSWGLTAVVCPSMSFKRFLAHF